MRICGKTDVDGCRRYFFRNTADGNGGEMKWDCLSKDEAVLSIEEEVTLIQVV